MSLTDVWSLSDAMYISSITFMCIAIAIAGVFLMATVGATFVSWIRRRRASSKDK